MKSKASTKRTKSPGANKARDNEKSKEWERRRRDRQNEAFKALAQLLPHHDPAKDPAKIDVLERSTQFIKELRLSNSRLLTQQTQADETSKKIEELQDELNKLILRVKQLTLLLNKANIPIPMGPFIKALGKKRLKWTKQLTTDDLKKDRLNKSVDTQSQSVRQKGENMDSDSTKRIETRISTTSVIIASSPLKEANSVDLIPKHSDSEGTTIAIAGVLKSLQKSILPTPDAMVLPAPPATQKLSTIPVETKLNTLSVEKSGTPSIPIIENLKAQQCLSFPPQPTTIPNITFPFQTTYVLSGCSIPQPPIIARFTIGTSPRIILRKPPLSSAGDIPKVAIPALRRIPKPIPVVKRRRAKHPKSKKNATASHICQIEKIPAIPVICASMNVHGTVEADNSLLSSNSSEPQPILVDISDPGESEIEQQPQERVAESLSENTDKIGPKSGDIPESKVENGSSVNSNQIDIAQHNDKSISEVAEIPESSSTESDSPNLILRSTKPLESETEILNPPITVIVSETNDNRESDPTTENAESTNVEVVLQTTTKPSVPQISEEMIDSAMQKHEKAVQILKNIKHLDEVMESVETQSEEVETLNSDKISECIARSIDLIDHPEAELMELGADWGVAVDSHSPKSPISPTQMFLSMFPLLPRESIVTVAGGVDTSGQQIPHQHSITKNSNSQYGPGSRFSFFIDSMLPEQIHPQASAVDPIALSVPAIENSVCLAMTPITPSCVQQNNNSLNNNYSSPPSFQSLANVLSNNSSFNASSNSLSAKVTSKMPSIVSSRLTPLPLPEDRTHTQSKNSQPPSSRSFPGSSSFDTFQTLLPETGNQKKSCHQTPAQEFYPRENVEKPHSSQPPASVSHAISQMFNPFINNPPPHQNLTRPFHDYSYYPQEVAPFYNPQNPVSNSNSIANSNKNSIQNTNNSRSECHNNHHRNEDIRNRQDLEPRSGTSSQLQPQSQPVESEIFRPASFNQNQTRTNVNLAPVKQTKTPDKQRVNVQNKFPPKPLHSSTTAILDCNPAISVQNPQFLNPQYLQTPGKQCLSNSDINFNFGQNQQGMEISSVQSSSHFDKTVMPRSFPVPISSNNAVKQISNQSVQNIEFNADFLAYSSQGTPHPYKGHRQGLAQYSYDTASRPPVSLVVTTPTTRAKATYRTVVQTPVQHTPPIKPRRPPFYLPDPPPPQMLMQTHYDTSGQHLQPNFTNQPSNASMQPHQPGHSHYSNNFTPQFYSNRNITVGREKEYVFPNSQQNATKVVNDFYPNHNVQIHSQQHQLLSSDPRPPLNPKKSVATPNFTSNNVQHSTISRINNPHPCQNQISQIPVSRPVNWMTDPPYKKPSNGPSASNPFSVSKLVGNNSNNYCTEALLRKNPNPDWNDFHNFVPPVPPSIMVPPEPPGSSISNVNSIQLTSQPSFSSHSQHQPVDNQYFSHNYPANTSFGNFDSHTPHHYNTPNQMSSNNQGQSHGHISGHGTNSSVSNFNLSSIFPEMNDKRGNNTGNCGYYAGNNGK